MRLRQLKLEIYYWWRSSPGTIVLVGTMCLGSVFGLIVAFMLFRAGQELSREAELVAQSMSPIIKDDRILTDETTANKALPKSLFDRLSDDSKEMLTPKSRFHASQLMVMVREDMANGPVKVTDHVYEAMSPDKKLFLFAVEADFVDANDFYNLWKDFRPFSLYAVPISKTDFNSAYDMFKAGNNRVISLEVVHEFFTVYIQIAPVEGKRIAWVNISEKP